MILPTLVFILMMGSFAEEYPTPHMVLVGPTGSGSYSMMKHLDAITLQARAPLPMHCLAVTQGVTMAACSVSAEVWTPALRTQPLARDIGLESGKVLL